MGLRIVFGQNIVKDCFLQLCCWKFSIGSRYDGPKDFLTFGLGPKNFIFPGPHHSLELVVANLVDRPNWHVKNHLMLNRWTKSSCFCHWHDLLFLNANEALFSSYYAIKIHPNSWYMIVNTTYLRFRITYNHFSLL